jgi:uncharacterized membrane protein YraQ (UPF0718 family)
MSKAWKFVRNNLFFAGIVLVYIVLMIVSPSIGIASVKSSHYFVMEMLQIMPVVFVLTALLDTWVPQETIVKLLGKDAKVRGAVLSFVLGSISAGPVYAAFPVCIMLLKKGASIANIVIILSSWAVIKLPMLLNEAKFLGLPFMALRWVLTVAAIVLMAAITSKLVKKEHLPHIDDGPQSLSINRDACIGCGLCVKHCPEAFTMRGRKAEVIVGAAAESEKLVSAAKACPVRAIQGAEEVASHHPA